MAGRVAFEICVGAILTQNTSWKNVEHAIANLKAARILTARKMHALPVDDLAELIRPAGYYNMKARRLSNFLNVLVGQFGASLKRLMHGDTATVRERLLAINGIGPETADSMLLYAGDHTSFVIDTYTKRIFTRHAWCADSADYDTLKLSAKTTSTNTLALNGWITGRITTRNWLSSAAAIVGRKIPAARSARWHRCYQRKLDRTARLITLLQLVGSQAQRPGHRAHLQRTG